MLKKLLSPLTIFIGLSGFSQTKPAQPVPQTAPPKTTTTQQAPKPTATTQPTQQVKPATPNTKPATVVTQQPAKPVATLPTGAKPTAVIVNAGPPAPMAPLPGSKPFKAKDGTLLYINNPEVKIASATVSIDTSTSKNFYCVNIELNAVTGSTFAEMLEASHLYSVADKNNKPLPFKDRVLKKCGGSLEDNLVNYTIKLPYKLKTDPERVYNVSYMLQTRSGKTIQVFYKTK